MFEIVMAIDDFYPVSEVLEWADTIPVTWSFKKL
jgi:hypothetical protein